MRANERAFPSATALLDFTNKRVISVKGGQRNIGRFQAVFRLWWAPKHPRGSQMVPNGLHTVQSEVEIYMSIFYNRMISLCENWVLLGVEIGLYDEFRHVLAL